jgi:hypothetical protein
MARARDAVRENPVMDEVRAIMLETQRDGAKGPRHRTAVDDQCDRKVKGLREIRTRGIPVVEAHDTLDEYQVSVLSRAVEQVLAVTQAPHPQIELIDRVSRRARENHRINEVRSRLEDPHPPPTASGEAGEGRRDRGLPLARSRGGNEQRRD